jgi:hypothetical protein
MEQRGEKKACGSGAFKTWEECWADWQRARNARSSDLSVLKEIKITHGLAMHQEHADDTGNIK